MLSLEKIAGAVQRLKGVALNTPLVNNINLSEQYEANVLLKREDLQPVRSYKIRGAYNKICSLPKDLVSRGVVCASAGNHAQGVAYTCNKLQIPGKIFMPVTTPKQKLTQVKMFGKNFIEVILTGDTFDDCSCEANKYCKEHQLSFIPPFDDEEVIAGQATVAVEILEACQEPIDYLFVPVGGGGLAAGMLSYFKQKSPHTKVIGVEPEGAASLKVSIKNGVNTTLSKIDKFVDGAAVKRVGELNFAICKNLIDDVTTVHEGKVCSTILRLYNEEAIIVEPAGALAISALENYKDEIKGKTVVCIVSGSNNDITRTEEIKERSLLYEGLKHYFVVSFAQRAGALKEFVTEVLGPDDDITYFEFSKKNSREKGPGVVGIELKSKNDFIDLIGRLEEKKINYEYLNTKPDIMNSLL